MKIGKVEIENNLALAPMAGVTDLSFRTICKEMGVGLLYTEMISIKGLKYSDEKTEEIMRTNNKETPIVLQIFGSDPETFKKVVYEKINNITEFDIIDINMGCPAPKIVKNGDGSALMKDPERIKQIVKAVVRESTKPVTVKIRKGWDDNINALEVAKIIESEGASAIAIHGRTREEFYSGNADWNIIRSIKNNVSVPVIGNGDVFNKEDIKKMIAYTGCDMVMIGRGARGNPWIFGENEPTKIDKIDMSLKHMKLLCENKTENIATKEIRKHIGWYLKGLKGSSEIRNRINKSKTKLEIEEILREYKDSLDLTM